MRRGGTFVAAAQAAMLSVLAATAAHAEILVAVDKAAQQMTVSVDGETRWVWPVSTGKSGYATPAGTFRARRLARRHFSREWGNTPMPHAIFFTRRGHAVHGSLETLRIGTPASRGCVRLAPENAAKLFALVKKRGMRHTSVVVSGENPVVARRAPPNPGDDAILSARRAFAEPYGALPDWPQDEPDVHLRPRDQSLPLPGSLLPLTLN